MKLATIVLVTIPVLAFSYVLLGSLAPSQKADAVRGTWAFPAATLDNLEPGEVRTGMTERGPIFVVRPTEEIWADLESNASRVKNSPFNTYDRRRDLLIVWGVYEYREGNGCALMHAPKGYFISDDDIWLGGYSDPCSGLRFDYAGRLMDVPKVWTEPNLRRPILEVQQGGWIQIAGLMNLPDAS